MVHLLDAREVRRIDLVQAAAEPGQRAEVGVDCLLAQILEQVIMRMDAVQAGIARQRLVQVREVIVNEMRKWLRWVHPDVVLLPGAAPWGALILSMVQ